MRESKDLIKGNKFDTRLAKVQGAKRKRLVVGKEGSYFSDHNSSDIEDVIVEDVPGNILSDEWE